MKYLTGLPDLEHEANAILQNISNIYESTQHHNNPDDLNLKTQ